MIGLVMSCDGPYQEARNCGRLASSRIWLGTRRQEFKLGANLGRASSQRASLAVPSETTSRIGGCPGPLQMQVLLNVVREPSVTPLPHGSDSLRGNGEPPLEVFLRCHRRLLAPAMHGI